MLPVQDEDAPQIFCENGLYGLRAADGTVPIEPRYQAFYEFDESRSAPACSWTDASAMSTARVAK